MKRKLFTILLALAVLAAGVIPAAAVGINSQTPNRCGIYLVRSGSRYVIRWLCPTKAAAPSAPAKVQTPAKAQTQSGSVLSYEREVVSLVNAERAKYGLPALTLRADLCEKARIKSQDMHDSRYFSHESPNYGSPFAMMRSFGITYSHAGENIAMGYATPAAVVSAWMNSAGHRANILSANYTAIGVGYVQSGGYWTQWFVG